MDEFTLLLWLQSVTEGIPGAPGSYEPGTNPLSVMTGR